MSEQFPEVIQQALDFEEKGASYYQNKAKEAKNPLVKRLFLSLAVEENEHQMRIHEIYQAMKTGQDFPEASTGHSLEDSIRDFFKSLSQSELKLEDNVEALTVAMDLERTGYAMYQDAADKSSTNAEKEFFKAMQKEERDHLTALENVYYFLTDTEDWFANEEAKVWNWMNL